MREILEKLFCEGKLFEALKTQTQNGDTKSSMNLIEHANKHTEKHNVYLLHKYPPMHIKTKSLSIIALKSLVFALEISQSCFFWSASDGNCV